LSLVLVACGDAEDESASGDEEDDGGGSDPEYISFLTGGTSGTYYPLGGAIAKIIDQETDIQPDAVSSNASADNIIALVDGDAEIEYTQTDVAVDAAEGINIFYEDWKSTSL